MQKTFNFFYAFLLAILGFGVTLMAEDITLTTYYPAPYGAYDELTTTGDTYLATTSGKVGIGTTNPGDTLEVKTSGSGIRVTDSTVINRIISSSATGKGYIGTLSNHPLVLRTGDSDKITIDTAGSVGIGTTSPNYTLEVSGTIRSTGKGTFTGGIDPPYVSFTSESHESIRERAKDVEEHEKVMQFWNGNKHRLEFYVIEESKFYTIEGELIEE